MDNEGETGVCHDQCRPVESEILALEVATELLADPELERVCEQATTGDKPDFRSRRHAVEVKRLASPAMQSYLDARKRYIGDRRHFPIEGLEKTWMLTVGVTEAVNSHDRAAPAPAMKHLVKKLTPLLRELDKRRSSDAFADPHIWPRVRELLPHDTQLLAIPTHVPQPFAPGLVLIGDGYWQERAAEIDWDVAEFLQRWLHSEHASNARDSLASEHGRKRCVILIAELDGPAAKVVHTLAEDPDALPTTALSLPPEIDAVIVVSGSHVIDFGVGDGWRRHTYPSTSNREPEPDIRE